MSGMCCPLGSLIGECQSYECALMSAVMMMLRDEVSKV